MDVSWIIFGACVAWFACGVACGHGYYSRYGNVGSSGAADEQTGPIFPRAWIPPFMRNDWVVEEVISGKEVYRAACRVDLRGKFIYMDRRMNKMIEVVFRDGLVTAVII